MKAIRNLEGLLHQVGHSGSPKLRYPPKNLGGPPRLGAPLEARLKKNQGRLKKKFYAVMYLVTHIYSITITIHMN